MDQMTARLSRILYEEPNCFKYLGLYEVENEEIECDVVQKK